MLHLLEPDQEVFQGHFGEFTLTRQDRLGVVIYRGALLIAALCFATGAIAVLWPGGHPGVIPWLTALYAGFCLALGISLVTIHIYMASLHRLLQLFWASGCGAAIAIALSSSEPLALTVYNHPWALVGVGLVFVALTGIYFKEAFCFNRLETKLLTPLVPFLLLGHWFGLLPVSGERILLGLWAGLFLIFACRKVLQPIPPDIGDKSVFSYLQGQH